MSTVILENKTWTPEEYFEIEKYSEEKHEFYFGNLIIMPGESRIANKINRNFVRALEKGVNPDLFEIYNHDVRLVVRKNEIYRYPDIVVAPDTDDIDEYVVKSPVIMVEVASEKSWRTDTGAKRREYSALPSLKYYLIVSQEETFVELCIRKGSDWTFVHFEELDETIELSDFNLKITLSEIYHRVKFADSKTDS